MPQAWYALHVRPRYERLVSDALRAKGYEEFLPLYQLRRAWSDRMRDVRFPLFPGYLFCRIDPERRLPVLITPGVLSIVGVGRTPAPVSDREVAWVRQIVDSESAARPWELPAAGQVVRLTQGPLRGLEGVLIEFSGQTHLLVSVVILQRSVCVRIERGWARPVEARPPGPAQSFCRRQFRHSA